MKYSKIKVGMVKEITHLISQDDINKFAELTGDDNKLHLDKDYAAKTSFKKPVAHGMLGASFISTIIALPPCPTNISAVLAPIPLAPPVIRQTLFANLMFYPSSDII